MTTCVRRATGEAFSQVAAAASAATRVVHEAENEERSLHSQDRKEEEAGGKGPTHGARRVHEAQPAGGLRRDADARPKRLAEQDEQQARRHCRQERERRRKQEDALGAGRRSIRNEKLVTVYAVAAESPAASATDGAHVAASVRWRVHADPMRPPTAMADSTTARTRLIARVVLATNNDRNRSQTTSYAISAEPARNVEPSTAAVRLSTAPRVAYKRPANTGVAGVVRRLPGEQRRGDVEHSGNPRAARHPQSWIRRSSAVRTPATAPSVFHP